LQEGGAVAALENADSLITLEKALQENGTHLSGQRAQYPDVELLLDALVGTAAVRNSSEESDTAYTSPLSGSWAADAQLDSDLPPVLALEAFQRRLAAGVHYLTTQQQERNTLTSEIRRRQRALRATNHTLQILQRKLDQLNRERPHTAQRSSSRPSLQPARAAKSSSGGSTSRLSVAKSVRSASPPSAPSTERDTDASAQASRWNASSPSEPMPDDDGNPDLVLDAVPSHNYYRNLSANPSLSAAFYGKEKLVSLITNAQTL
jgi:hypothetical protein